MSGIFGIFGHPSASCKVALGLYGLQHRGTSGWGIVSTAADHLYKEDYAGLINRFCLSGDIIPSLPGSAALGHVQFVAPGKPQLVGEREPLVWNGPRGPVALAFDGDFPRLPVHRAELFARGQALTTSLAIEIFYRFLFLSPRSDFLGALEYACNHMDGAYAMLVLTPGSLIAIRDPRGVRPLSIGQLEGAYVFASETCALDQIEAQFVRDVQPGEVVVADAAGLWSRFPFPSLPLAHCIFEHVYFSRWDSVVCGQSVERSRHEMGRRLRRRYPIAGDIVTPVPDSGTPAAIGYAAESGIPFGFGLIRNHYERGNVVEPVHSIRRFGTRARLNPNRDVVAGRRVIVIDDSMARGVTAPRVVEMLREAGATEVHLLICFPPIVQPCDLGIDSHASADLIANRVSSPAQLRERIGADSLNFLLPEDLEPDVTSGGFCTACYSKNHPITISV